MFSLCYLPTAGRLTLTVIKCRNLKAMDITGYSGSFKRHLRANRRWASLDWGNRLTTDHGRGPAHQPSAHSTRSCSMQSARRPTARSLTVSRGKRRTAGRIHLSSLKYDQQQRARRMLK
ncbi:hypothetical protein CRUP_029243 [Coryphaenoides rupestris]|nr:hypothetical protein CRUP_029243 [Coryphaenoides rupestris]